MDFKELSNHRYSVRKYTDEPVSKADIDYIMECVRLAPSACNRQPWKFLLVVSDEAKQKPAPVLRPALVFHSLRCTYSV